MEWLALLHSSRQGRMTREKENTMSTEGALTKNLPKVVKNVESWEILQESIIFKYSVFVLFWKYENTDQRGKLSIWGNCKTFPIKLFH